MCCLENLKITIENKLDNIYSFNFDDYLKKNEFMESSNTEAVVALSGGVDSSFSLILAKKLGFNPVAVTVDPGTIILPNQFKKNIQTLTFPFTYSNVLTVEFSFNVYLYNSFLITIATTKVNKNK